MLVYRWTKVDRRAAADTMTSAQGSTPDGISDSASNLAPDPASDPVLLTLLLALLLTLLPIANKHYRLLAIPK